MRAYQPSQDWIAVFKSKFVDLLLRKIMDGWTDGWKDGHGQTKKQGALYI